jgi:hypothetical protein
MVIIIGAGANLAELAAVYDRSQGDFERERIAAEVYELIGGQIGAMILHRARGLKLSSDQLDALAWQALLRGLNESGMTRFKLASAPDSDWQPMILSMMEAAKTSPASPQARIWGMLSPETKSAVLSNLRYIKYTAQYAVINDINALLRRRDLYDPQAWSNIRLPEETTTLLKQEFDGLSGTELSRLNALLVASAFPVLSVPPAPKKNLLGYISATVVPQLQPEIYETATGKKSDVHLAEASAFLRQDLEAVRQMQERGTLPDEWARLSLAERVYRHQKQRIEKRYGPVIRWWNDRIRDLQPRNPYTVNNSGSLKSARELFEQNQDRVPSHLWKPIGAPYNLPSQVLAPFGLRTIERLLATEGFNRNAPSKVKPHVAPVYTQNAGDPDAERLLAGGHQSKAYRWLIQRLFKPEQAEYQIGMFLAATPRPAGPEIEQFLSTLPDDIAEDIEQAGWNRTAYRIDSQVLQAVKNPAVREEIMRALQAPLQSVMAMLGALRSDIFCRTANFIRKRAG